MTRRSLVSVLVFAACTAPDVAMQADKAPPVEWSDTEPKRLCLPVEPTDVRGYVPHSSSETACGQDLVWPCDRGITCSADGGCVCRCDVGRDDDCAGVWFDWRYPGVVTSAQCEAPGRCVIERAR